MNVNTRRRPGTDAGFSLIEMMVVVGLVMIVGAMATGSVAGFVNAARADGGMESALSVLRVARDQAVSERRNFVITFTNPNVIRVFRQEVPSNALTQVSERLLEGKLSFRLTPDAPDTPDGFGDDQAIAFGLSPQRMFTSEGTFVDNSGDPLNGTIFMAIEGDPLSGRAITILGATALLHTWKWDGRAWID